MLSENRRTFEVAGRTVVISVGEFTRDDGSRPVDIAWQPAPPARLTLDDIARFDREKRRAVATLLAQAGAVGGRPADSIGNTSKRSQ